MVSSERGALTARRQPCRVEDHCRDAVAGQPASRRAAVQCEPGLLALVQPGHLDQILANLLSNADKYAGGATLVCAETNASGDVEISVVDTGPGIPADFRDDLFQRFSRSASTAAHVTGTGLGLFISRELARANGGDLHHRDADPAGSIFVVTLPRATAAA
jgi:signal transduction histidine kinase